MAKLELTDAERLILANQYEILGLLKNDGDDSYERLANNLRDGHKWIYAEKFHLSPNLSDQDTELVLNILAVYRAIQDSYEALSDKTGIEKHDLTFPGFDGNNEAELLGFSRALAANGNYRDTIGDPARNSHSGTADMYSRMIEEWKRLGKPYKCTKEQIVAILKARAFPA